MVAIYCEAFEEDFVRQTWHIYCESPERRQTRLSYTAADNRRRKVERDRQGFAMVKRHYRRVYTWKQRVRCESGRTGIVVGCDGQYVQVLLDGQKHDGNHHPMSLTSYEGAT